MWIPRAEYQSIPLNAQQRGATPPLSILNYVQQGNLHAGSLRKVDKNKDM